MNQEQLIEAIAQFSDYEANYYLAKWDETQSDNHREDKKQPSVQPTQMITSPNAGSLMRLLLMTIILEEPDGMEWLQLKIANDPYQGERLDFPTENVRSVGENVMKVISSTLNRFSFDFRFGMSAGKVSFSMSLALGANEYARQQYQQAIKATPWFVEAPSLVTVGIITPIEIERNAFSEHFTWKSDAGPITKNHYAIGEFKGKHHHYLLVHRSPGQGIVPSTSAIKDLVYEFKPALIVMVGVAGGVRKIGLGDLIVATKAYGYERGQATDEGINVRPDMVEFTHALVEQCRTVALQENWKTRIKQKPEFPITQEPNIVFGRIASGNLVIQSITSEIYDRIQKHFNDTVAVDMEAYAFEALKEHPEIKSLTIRGISDTLSDKHATDGLSFQALAAARASAFAFEFLYQMKL